MSISEPTVIDLQAAVRCLETGARHGTIHDLPDEDLQNLMTTAVLAFSGRAQAGDISEPFVPESGIIATDVAVVTSAMLKAVNMQVFELGLWETWGRAQAGPPTAE